jgi:thiosulfate/3-mercaptopyruvate sulfurtransferase
MVHRRALLAIGLVLTMLLGAGGAVLAQEASRPVTKYDGYAHPEWFATVAWLNEHLGDDNVKIIALTPPEAFVEGHIPGAVQIDWPALKLVETSAGSVDAWQEDMEGILTDLGIERDDTVVVYDGGTLIAPHMWWILHQLGHADVRVLDGGFEAWLATQLMLQDFDVTGMPFESGEVVPEPAAERYAGTPVTSAMVTIDEALAAHEGGDALFLDTRQYEDEYALGHIPGAINLPSILNARGAGPKYWKNAEELRLLYAGAGVLPDAQIITYCATGERSAATYFALLQLGYENVSLFTGSFSEWSADPDRPVAMVEA